MTVASLCAGRLASIEDLPNGLSERAVLIAPTTVPHGRVPAAHLQAVLEALPLHENSDDFVFDNQMLAQILWLDYTIAEVSCPTKYFAEASSINLPRSIKYGVGCLKTGLQFRLAKTGLVQVLQ